MEYLQTSHSEVTEGRWGTKNPLPFLQGKDALGSQPAWSCYPWSDPLPEPCSRCPHWLDHGFSPWCVGSNHFKKQTFLFSVQIPRLYPDWHWCAHCAGPRNLHYNFKTPRTTPGGWGIYWQCHPEGVFRTAYILRKPEHTPCTVHCMDMRTRLCS